MWTDDCIRNVAPRPTPRKGQIDGPCEIQVLPVLVGVSMFH